MRKPVACEPTTGLNSFRTPELPQQPGYLEVDGATDSPRTSAPPQTYIDPMREALLGQRFQIRDPDPFSREDPPHHLLTAIAKRTERAVCPDRD